MGQAGDVDGFGSPAAGRGNALPAHRKTYFGRLRRLLKPAIMARSPVPVGVCDVRAAVCLPPHRLAREAGLRNADDGVLTSQHWDRGERDVGDRGEPNVERRFQGLWIGRTLSRAAALAAMPKHARSVLTRLPGCRASPAWECRRYRQTLDVDTMLSAGDPAGQQIVAHLSSITGTLPHRAMPKWSASRMHGVATTSARRNLRLTMVQIGAALTPPTSRQEGLPWVRPLTSSSFHRADASAA